MKSAMNMSIADKRKIDDGHSLLRRQSRPDR